MSLRLYFRRRAAMTYRFWAILHFVAAMSGGLRVEYIIIIVKIIISLYTIVHKTLPPRPTKITLDICRRLFIQTPSSRTTGVVRSEGCCRPRRPRLRRSLPPVPQVVCPGCNRTAPVPRTCTSTPTPGPRRHQRPGRSCARPTVCR